MARPPLPIGAWGEVRYQQTAAGRWRARAMFRDKTGATRDVERTGKTKGAAKTALLDYLTNTAPDQGSVLGGTTRVRDATRFWLDGKTKISDRTRQRYRIVVTNHIVPAMGDLLLRECSVTRVTTVLREIHTEKGAATALSCRKVLSQVLGLAARLGALPHNPVRDAETITVARKKARAMTPEEIRRVREGIRRWEAGQPIDPDAEVAPATKPRRGRPPTRDLADLIDVLFATGGRIGESLALRWPDVDLDTGRATIAATVVWEDPTEPGGRRRLVRQEHRKGEGDELDLHLPDFVVATLRARKARTTVENVNEAIFPSVSGTWRDPNNVRKQWRPLFAAMDLAWVTPHSFRRTVATLIARDSDAGTAASQLGNGEEVTRRHYVEPSRKGPDVRGVLSSAAHELQSPAA